MDHKQVIEHLKSSYIFSEISSRGLSIIAKHVDESNFKKGQIIFNEGDTGDKLHILAKGVVKITKYARQGKTKTLAILRENDCFGEMSILTKEARSATVEALTPTTTLSITRENFEYFIGKEPTISLQIIKTLSDRLAKADRDIKNLALGDAKTRISCVLGDFKEDIKTIKFTHQEIADLAGLTRETTTRTLKQMENEGVITIKDRQIKIKSIEMLEDLCT